MMDQARWDRVQELFHGAAGRSESGRRSFLQEACGEDRELLAAVEAMLEEDSRASLLDCDVAQVASQVLGDSLSAPFREFGPYRIKNALGEGGMGVVYLAERTDLGNLVAIKILRDAWLSPARRGRFAAEQRTLARLNHPSIARLYDANTLPDGTPWFVMEYVDGIPLTSFCSRNNCSVENRLKLLRAVGEAVQYAHGQGIVHRDLKPSNILVKEDGSPRLLDFGIAEQLNPTGLPVDRTRTDFSPMTPAYAAPEQLRGEPAGAGADVYSLGVILYELLTGRLPFEISRKAASEAAAIVTAGVPARPSAVAQRSASPRSGGTASWADLDALCLTAMHKDPHRRYRSVEALIRDIGRCLNGEPLEARSSSLAARGRSRAEPRSHDLVRERGARRKSMLVISRGGQPGYRAKSWRRCASSSLRHGLPGHTAAGIARRNARKVHAAFAVCALVVAAVVAAVVITLSVSRNAASSPPGTRSVAVLPFRNAGSGGCWPLALGRRPRLITGVPLGFSPGSKSGDSPMPTYSLDHRRGTT